MTTVDNRLKHVTLKIRRAKKHAADLNQKMGEFFSTNPYKIATKVDPDTNKLIYYVSSVEAVPDVMALVAGDAIQNLMSALDHLAFQLVCSDTEDNPPNPNWIYFPISDDASKYNQKKSGKIAGASQATFDVIDRLKPYKGGNDLIWKLYRLNIIEKHRLLLTVGSLAAGIHLGQLLATHVGDDFSTEAVKAMKSMNQYLMPADKGFPLQEGFELYIGAEDEKPNPELQFRFRVALNEPGIAEGEPLLELINQFVTLVEDITKTLTPLLK